MGIELEVSQSLMLEMPPLWPDIQMGIASTLAYMITEFFS
jgi:hypothetical protein